MSDSVHPSDRMTRREVEESGVDVSTTSRIVVDLTDEIFGSPEEIADVPALSRRLYCTRYASLEGLPNPRPIEFGEEDNEYLVHISELDLSARALRIQLRQHQIARVESHFEADRLLWYADFSHGSFRQFLPTDTWRLSQGVSRTHVMLLRRTLHVVKSALETY